MVRPPFHLAGIALGLMASLGVGASELEIIHTARAGDTLIGIEREYLAPPHRWRGLKTLNRVADPMRIPVGTPLRIPESWLRVEPRSARVVALNGEVTMNGRPLSVDARVPVGALLRTGMSGVVTLAMPDQSRLTVQPGSQAQVEKLQGYKGIAGQSTQINLEQGRLETTVTPQRGPAARYQIRTPTASLSVRGTAFRVGSDPSAQLSQAEVTQGEVAVSNARASTAQALPAGYGVVARAGEALPQPRPLLPAPRVSIPAVLEQLDPVIPITPLAGAIAYRAQLARDEDFHDVVSTDRLNSATVRYPGLPDGDYVLHVRAIDEAGLEGYDSTTRFTLRARPTPPTPATDGSLSWVPGPESGHRYRLQIAGPEGFERPSIERDTDALSLAEALPPGRHRWRVASLRPDGRPGPWSSTAVSDIRQAPAGAQLSVFNNRLRFAWPGAPGQIYDIQIATDADFREIVLEENIGEAAVTWPAPAGVRYYLRLRTRDPDGGVSPWSAPQTLRMLIPLLTWSLSAPEHASP